ncbi:MAG: hypothetical protein NVS3B12_21300 [Acidimicrobiales bacterium]
MTDDAARDGRGEPAVTTDDASPEPKTSIGRRRFLLLSGVGLAGVASACATKASVPTSLTNGHHFPGPAPKATTAPVAVKPTAPPGDERIFYNSNPFLEESPLNLVTGDLTPPSLHFVRWHGAKADVSASAYRLKVSGRVTKPLELSLADLQAMTARNVTAVVECAGNGRGFFPAAPKVSGTGWGYGAASCSQWGGIPVATIAQAAGLDPSVTMLVFVGGDELKVTRALPLAKAMDPDTIVALTQNGAPVRPENGYPARLLVPDWVGVANIKTVSEIIAVASEADLDQTTRDRLASYTTAQYLYLGPEYPTHPPAILQTVKAVISGPGPKDIVSAGPVTITGFAWSGSGHITSVEVSAADKPYQPAVLGAQVQHGWVRWTFPWLADSGISVIRARATDAAGHVQPDRENVKYNSLGYGYNGIIPVVLHVA